MPEPRPIGTFHDVESMLLLLRKRQLELELSNAGLERVCGFASGVVDKYLGPSRTKTPGAATLAILMDGLGLCGMFVVDAAKMAKRKVDYEVEGPRIAYAAREHTRPSREAMRRCRPVLMTELALMGAKARWAGPRHEPR
jgi:hypothetical protein